MLFKTSDKLKEYAELTQVNFASIKTTIRIVEEDMLVPIIGTTLYNSLCTAYFLIENESSLSAANQLLLDKCRMLIGAYVAYSYAPKAEVQLSDAGLQRQETATHKTAFGYQGKNYREQKLREAESATEALLSFLEENKASYPDWTGSNAFSRYRSLFIKTGSEFNELFPSHSPHRNYWAMRAKMIDVEEQNIKKTIGEDLYNALKAKDKGLQDFTAKEADLLFKLKKAIANFTVAFSIPFLNVRIDANGLTVLSGTVGNKDMEVRTVADANSISSVVDHAKEAGSVWLQDALQYLKNNASHFPQWAAPSEKKTESVNTCLGGSFGMI